MFEILLRGILLFPLLILPGAWIAFSGLLKNVDLWDRLGLSFALSIPMSCAQFLALAYMGVGTDHIPWVILITNLGAVWLIARSWQWVPIQGYRQIIPGALVLPLAVLIIHANAPNVYQWSHTFLHADLIYALMENPTAPEEWQLAGLGTGYPWFGHLQRVLLTQVLNQSPISAYLWINPAMAFGFGTLSILVVRAVGGRVVAMSLAPIIAALSTNPIGALAKPISSSLWSGIERFHFLMGDPRYDVTGIKFLYLNTNQVGLILLLALLLTILRSGSSQKLRATVPLWLICLVGTGLVYPLYLPSAAVFLGAAGITWMVDRTKNLKDRLRNVSLLYMSVVLAAACTYFLVTYQTGDRVTGAGIELNVPGQIWRHAVATITALLIPISAWLYFLTKGCPIPRGQLIFLSIAAITSSFMAVLLHIPNFRNEYKFVMVAAICGLPFVALLLERLWQQSRVPWTGAILLLVIIVGGGISVYPRMKTDQAPFEISFSNLDQKLSDPAGLGDALTVIREKTEPGTPTLVGQTELHVTPFTRRPVYVLYNEDAQLTGLGMRNGYLLYDVKGFDPALLESRQNRLNTFLNTESVEAREQAYRSIRNELGKPLVVLSERTRQFSLSSWMTNRDAELLHEGVRYSVWYLK